LYDDALTCVRGGRTRRAQVWNVTPALHTPLMSVTNAISGAYRAGSCASGTRRMNGDGRHRRAERPPDRGRLAERRELPARCASCVRPARDAPPSTLERAGFLAAGIAMFNVTGGFWVTQRMLFMFRNARGPKTGARVARVKRRPPRDSPPARVQELLLTDFCYSGCKYKSCSRRVSIWRAHSPILLVYLCDLVFTLGLRARSLLCACWRSGAQHARCNLCCNTAESGVRSPALG
jgi:hypothetical protein